MHALDLDEVKPEAALDWVRDFPRPQSERRQLERLDHHAAAEPAQLAAQVARPAVVGGAPGGRGEVGAGAQRHQDRLRLLARVRPRCGIRFGRHDDLAELGRKLRGRSVAGRLGVGRGDVRER